MKLSPYLWGHLIPTCLGRSSTHTVHRFVLPKIQFNTTLCPEKTRPKCFLVISSLKFGRFWWNLVHCILNKSAAKSCGNFAKCAKSRWKLFTRFCSKFIQETVYQISPESPKFYRRYYKKTFCLIFSGHTVGCYHILCQSVSQSSSFMCETFLRLLVPSTLSLCVVRDCASLLHRSGKFVTCFRCCCCSRLYLSRLRFISDDAYVMTGKSQQCLTLTVSVKAYRP